MATSAASGTQSATLDTEHTLATVTDAGSYVLAVDLSALALGDVVVLRVKSRVTSGGTTRLVHQSTYAHVQSAPVALSIPVASAREFVATLEQTDGTARSFPWEVLSL